MLNKDGPQSSMVPGPGMAFIAFTRFDSFRETVVRVDASGADEFLLLNLVERLFGKLAEKRLRQGVFHSVPELIDAIYQHLDAYNVEPKPFVWIAKVEDILRKASNCKATSGDGTLGT